MAPRVIKPAPYASDPAQSQVAAFAWTSAAGQEIERLPTGR